MRMAQSSAFAPSPMPMMMAATISGPSTERPYCPTCGSRALQQLLSSFAVNSAERRQLHRDQGRKVAQKDLTEQRHAEMEAVVHHHREHEH